MIKLETVKTRLASDINTRKSSGLSKFVRNGAVTLTAATLMTMSCNSCHKTEQLPQQKPALQTEVHQKAKHVHHKARTVTQENKKVETTPKTDEAQQTSQQSLDQTYERGREDGIAEANRTSFQRGGWRPNNGHSEKPEVTRVYVYSNQASKKSHNRFIGVLKAPFKIFHRKKKNPEGEWKHFGQPTEGNCICEVKRE